MSAQRKLKSLKDLLGDTPYVPRRPYQLTRTTDPITSFKAGAKQIDKLSVRQRLVRQHFIDIGPAGMTDLDLQKRIGDHRSTWRTRRGELTKYGFLADSGHTLFQDGSDRTVWVATEYLNKGV